MALRSFASGALFAEILGEGAPHILALHGWGRRGSDFRPSLEGLPALAPDLPGFGASPPPSAAVGADGYADVVSPVLDAFAGPAVLVGHSFGGRVALRLAVREPDRVAALVLTGVPLLRLRPPRPPSLGHRLARLGNRLGVVSDEAMERRRRRSGSADYRAATGVMRDILVKVIAETYETELGSIRAPITLLWGGDDTEVPVEVASRALSLREDAGLPTTFEMLTGVGHHLPLQAPGRLRAAVEALLA